MFAHQPSSVPRGRFGLTAIPVVMMLAGCAGDRGQASDAAVADSAPDAEANDAPNDGASMCTGDPHLCHLSATPNHCGDTSVSAECVAGGYECPDGFVRRCPQNSAECPDEGGLDMGGMACDLPEDEVCAYHGDALSCPGGFVDCSCNGDAWSCGCALSG